ncbi:MAG TPA: hypothetical protein PLD91_03810 [Spirochaetota bacterium]|nr:hypothetical protein [Spirochaetota bacterium]
MRRRRMYRTFAAALMAAAVLLGPSLRSKPDEPILVLGFDTKLLNDIQDRLLREAVMKELSLSGYRIVPVMEVESIFHDGRERQVRKLKREEMKSLCEEMKAGYACCGAIVPETAMADEEIRSGVNYLCTITLYIRGKNRFETVTTRAAGEDNLFRFYGALSKKIMAEMKKLL